ncbi:hypothetical protein FLONG3_8597 [Fusarium longipes]|uniref:Alpha/beta hydrolase fold-3 domain-containing protein n=1 Tax=Fusarium longipes TaxID=694270 RepID=A0A395S502_9HYPO|nr:hypothetical protein FLONG3_8597 [Fusarium longipes]
MADDTHRRIWQPLHPDIRDSLDPQYVAYHEAHLQYIEPDEIKEWDGSTRTKKLSLPPGGTKPVAVGSINDYDVGRFRISVAGPVRYLEARCLVISVDYGLAPENPFPAAVEDSVDAMRWVASSPTELQNIDTSRIAISGTSSGANLAIVAALSALDPEVPLPTARPSLPSITFNPPVSLLLFIPVVDNTATIDGAWKPNAETAPWLTPSRMEWYRKLYFTQDEHRSNWDASPNLAPDALLKKLPKTWMAVAEMDLLAPEASAFSRKLEDLGVDIETLVVQGGTHSILSLHGVIDRGYKMIENAVQHLQETFGTG